MRIYRGLVAPAIFGLLLSACSSKPEKAVCDDPSVNAAAAKTLYAQQLYAKPDNLTGYQNIYERYANTETLFYHVDLYFVEDSMLVNSSNQAPPATNSSLSSSTPTDALPFDVEAVYFSNNSSSIDKKAFSELTKISKYLKKHPTKILFINGRADDLGSERYNKVLSKRRATKVKDTLVSLGANPNRIKLSWSGKYKSGKGSQYRVAEFGYE